MENEFKTSSGISLLLGSVIATATMVMHPSGGNLEYIARTSQVLLFSHSIAVVCMPFTGFGFWGLSQLLKTNNRVSVLFFIFCLGLFAAMIAAIINGFVLPIFAVNYAAAAIDADITKTLLNYGRYINFSMTSVFITAVAISITIWSVLILRTLQLPKWLGYYGLLIVTFGLAGICLKFDFTNLLGFRVFIAGLVAWKIAAGLLMIQKGR